MHPVLQHGGPRRCYIMSCYAMLYYYIDISYTIIAHVIMIDCVCICVCICIYMYIYIYIGVYVYVCVYIYIYIYI